LEKKCCADLEKYFGASERRATGASLRTPMPHLDSDQTDQTRPDHKSAQPAKQQLLPTTGAGSNGYAQDRLTARRSSHSQANVCLCAAIWSHLPSQDACPRSCISNPFALHSIPYHLQANQQKEYLSPFTRISTHRTSPVYLFNSPKWVDIHIF
jgi:hypothetical protein